MTEKLELKEKMQAVDLGLRELWDNLDDENQKLLKSEFFILNRYISNVKTPSRSIQEHYVYSVNECFNKNWFELQSHPKLLWMLLCMCGYDNTRTFFHQWIGFKKKENVSSRKVAFLSEIYPVAKMNEIELLAKIMTDQEIFDLAKQYGFDDKEIKKKLKK